MALNKETFQNDPASSLLREVRKEQFQPQPIVRQIFPQPEEHRQTKIRKMKRIPRNGK